MTHPQPPNHSRTLAVVDAENLLGPKRRNAYGEARRMATQLRGVAELADDDHIIVGSDVTLGLAIGRAFPGRRLVVGRGPNGADHALLSALGSVRFLAARYRRVVIASGDGKAFALLARALRAAGVEVWLVSRPGSLSRALAREATVIRPYGAIDTEAVA